MITDSTATPGENDRNTCLALGIQLRNESNLSHKGYDQLQVNLSYGKSQSITGTPQGVFTNPDSDGADGRPSKVAKVDNPETAVQVIGITKFLHDYFHQYQKLMEYYLI